MKCMDNSLCLTNEYTCITFMVDMGRKKREPSSIHAVRLPDRLWKVLETVTENEGNRFLNTQIWKIVEDWLVDNKYLKEDERKR